MDYKKAIQMRSSRRAYLPKSLEHRISVRLRESVFHYNQESGLRIRLVENDSHLFEHFLSGYGMFSGVQNYFAMIGLEQDECLREKVGYYGERLVLEATLLGLGTCWIGGTYQKSACIRQLHLKEEETLVCIIAVGNVISQRSLKEKIVHKISKRSSKSISEMSHCEGPMPESFRSGMEAVQKAPSALNKQPVLFTYGNGTVTATVRDPARQGIDLGIAMLHFEIGASSPYPFSYLHGKYQLELPS